MTKKLTVLLAAGALVLATGGTGMAVAFGTVDAEEATGYTPEAHPVAVTEYVPESARAERPPTPSPTPTSPDSADSDSTGSDSTDAEPTDPTPDADTQPGPTTDNPATERAPADSDPYGHDECRAQGGYIDVGSCVLPGGEEAYPLPDPDGSLEEYRRGVEEMGECIDAGTDLMTCADEINPPPP